MDKPEGYEKAQTQSFGSLVDNGTYHTNFRHASKLEEFFRQSIASALDGVAATSGASILECGCGAGVWLDVLDEMGKPITDVRYYGFDLTPEMVDVARDRLADRVDPSHLKVGDVLNDDAYTFEDASHGHDLVFAFDVVQQLPRELQLEACQTMLSHVKPGGCLVVFDHEHWSEYGLKMATRKFLTRRLGLNLVPKYYCNARYPRLSAIAEQLARDPSLAVAIKTTPSLPKRVLVVQRLV